MLCQVCFQAEATIPVLDRPSDDPLVESHYCLACHERKYINPPTGWIAVLDDPPPADPPVFPPLRFTIKDLMITAGVFAVLNAGVALFMRSGLVTGTPAQIRERTIKAFLVANPFFAVSSVEMGIFLWLVRAHTKNLTDGVPLSQPEAIHHLDRWTLARERGSPLGRVLLILWHTWPGFWLFWFVLWISLRTICLIATKIDPPLIAAAFVLIALGVQTFPLWGVVASTRRR